MNTVPTAALMMIAASTLATAQGLVQKASNPVPGQYIVTLADEALPIAEQQIGKPAEVAQMAGAVAERHRVEVRRTFSFAIKGFVARMTPDQAAALAQDPGVASVEDGLVEVTGVQDAPPSWGLDRIDQHGVPLDGEYLYNTTGSGVDVYIVDSGIRATHADFAGRVDTANAFTAVDDGYGTDDRFGHGTMVAGIVGGSTYGVAKGVTLHPVRVIDASGGGTISGVVAGIDWITQQFTSQATSTTTTTSRKGKRTTSTSTTRRPAVVNISLITGGSLAINNAVNNSINAGVVYVVAAGNNADDACWYSPSGVAAAITVGASNDADNVWAYSNGGTCVDVFAPGVAVMTTLSRNDTDTTLSTGTSVAAPHVAGAAALYLAANPTATPAEVTGAILISATPNVLAALPANTPNRLLYSAAIGMDQPPVANFMISVSRRTVTFNAAISTDDKGIVSYSWSFGDGTSGTGSQIKHSYKSSGVYPVTLTVTDTAGQQASITLPVWL
jgi:serine protease